MFKGASDQKNLDAKAPQISPEIMRVASERHQKGLMSPWVYQLLSLVRINHLLGVRFSRVKFYFFSRGNADNKVGSVCQMHKCEILDIEYLVCRT